MARRLIVKDPLTRAERSALMSKVRSRGNRSTEGVVEQILAANGIDGWVKHPSDIAGSPDFFFLEQRLAVFVDGCFWHQCPKCARNSPRSRRRFWLRKIEQNRLRDNRIRSQLRRKGFHVMRIWEHSLRDSRWLSRLRKMLHKCLSGAG